MSDNVSDKVSDKFIGEIRLVGFDFAPDGWALCEGQLLPIAEYQALYTLLGTTYGGDGRTTFALPDLRGRSVVGDGHGPNLTPVRRGEHGGRETVVLTAAELPAHSHQVKPPATNSNPTLVYPEGALPAAGLVGGRPASLYAVADSSDTHSTHMATFATDNAGKGQPVNVRAPYLGMKYIIALTGIFPDRP